MLTKSPKKTSNRSILKAKMEIRTNSDSNENEYNLILGNPENLEKGKMVFFPSNGMQLQLIPKKTAKSTKTPQSIV